MDSNPVNIRATLQTCTAAGLRWGAWPLIEWKNGNVRLREFARLRRSQWDSARERSMRQLARLREQLSYCHQHVPYYRKTWTTRPVIESLADLSRIPLLPKATVRNELESLVAAGFTPQSLSEAKTGGSTGVSLKIWFDRECEDRRNGMALLRNEWAGWQPAAPVGALWGNPPKPNNSYERLRAWVNDRFIYLDTAKLSESDAAEFLEKLRRRGIRVLYGHAHSLFLLATIGVSKGITAPPIAAIVSTSMVLLDPERTVIEQYFGCRVTDRYGCEEVGLIASECEAHDGMHINDEHLVVEIVDEQGRPVPEGEPGQIVVTDLINRGAPLIRYTVGDMSRWLPGDCSCGRKSPRMFKVEGRQADFLKRRDGVLVAGVSLVERTLTAIPGIQQLQLIQPELERVIARVVPMPGASLPETRETLVTAVLDAFVGQVTVDVEIVERLEQVGRGKYRFAICKC